MLARTFLLLVLAGCTTEADSNAGTGADPNAPAELPVAAAGQEVAVFAGGCFWCMETDFDKMPGVIATTSGYAGGHLDNPKYEDVVSETTGHLESVRVVFDAKVTNYADVVRYFFHHVDPTDGGGQFCDRGESYTSAVFPIGAEQLATAKAVKEELDKSAVLPGPIVTTIVPDVKFWAAENYHQNFHETNPKRYEPYRYGCGRDRRVAEVWGK